MLVPLMIGLGLVYFSALYGLRMSFTRWDIVRPPEWIGLENYRAVLQDELFWISVRNTARLTLLIVPLKIILGLGIALMINQPLRGITFFKLVYFFPAACSVVAIALLWGYLYDPTGLLNSMFGYLGLPKVYWLDPENAMNSIGIMNVWSGMGYIALLFLAGLQNIPTEYYEASRVDGANRLQQFWKITLPLLTPTTFFVLVILMIGALQTFGEVFILQGRLNSTRTIVQHIYNEAFARFNMGYASALAYILVVTIFIITFINLRLQKRWVNYDL
jgi:multiple sugar transport system permease protein